MKYICIKIKHFFILTCLLSLSFNLYAGTTGKIAGRVIDEETGEGLPFVNVIIEETTLGAASDPEGYFVILNVPPGKYNLTARMMGYQEITYMDVEVSIDFTTRLEISMKPVLIEISGITVTAERPLIEMDLTSTRAVVSADRIEALPTEEFIDLVNLQAGVVNGHFRGGRSSEVVYMLDGISITDPYSYDVTVDVENSLIKELQVISGTFNAEYGQAMSGVVNIVTREGGKEYKGRINAYSGDFISFDTIKFKNIDEIKPATIYNFEATLGGPFPGMEKYMSFYTTGRRRYSDGHLYGIRIFNPYDSCDFSKDDSEDWYIEATGDSNTVPMAYNDENSFYGKISVKPTMEHKVNYNFIWKDSEYKEYAHEFKYNPDGQYKNYDKSYTHMLKWNYLVNPKTFFELKLAYSSHDYERHVIPFEIDDVLDTSKTLAFKYAEDSDTTYYYYKDNMRYVHPDRLKDASNNAFLTGGTQMEHFYRNTKSKIARFDMNSQITKSHEIQFGFEYRSHILWLHEFTIIPGRDLTGNEIKPFEPDIPRLTSTEHNEYTNYPLEGAAYIQDKIEFRDLIANIGIRFDYFNPHWKVPTDLRDPNPKDPLRPDTLNPFNPNNPVRVTGEPWFRDVETKMQISPRIGLAYPITDRGVMHGSYGHFFQIPPFEYLYTDPEFEVYGQGLETRMGNADLKPQKTVIYEIGLQQQISEDISIDVTGFFKNIRNLLGTELYETYIGSQFARYVNIDYGNVRGITITLEGKYSQYLYASFDYTYQVAEGTASDPNAAFYDAITNRETEKYFIPLDWDQTHTINGTVTFGDAQKWGISIIGRYGTGFPYTPTYEEIRIASENSERKPHRYNIDLKANYNLSISDINLSLSLKVYNILNRTNEVDVYTDTGSASYTIIESPGVVRGINTLDEYLIRPNYYSSPRQIILGMSLEF